MEITADASNPGIRRIDTYTVFLRSTYWPRNFSNGVSLGRSQIYSQINYEVL